MAFAFAWPVGQAIAKPQAAAKTGAAGQACSLRGSWIDVRAGQPIGSSKLFGDFAGKPVVLLGESHDNSEHHRWQLHTLAALHGRAEKLVIGFEMFPRRVQGVLDRWVNGELTAKAFLKASDWRKVWGFDAELYLPLFNFARMNAIPMVALNVERSLVSSVGKEGWDAVAKEKREGLTDPAPAQPSYQRHLARVYLQKKALGKEAKSGAPPSPDDDAAIDDAKLESTIGKPEFQRFVQAQLTWDRAMAEALAAAKRKSPDSLIVGVIGSGHIEYFHGVPHQLRDLGIAGSAVLIPVEAGEACGKIGTGFADAIFTLNSPIGGSTLRERLKLGVLIRDVEGGARVEQVFPGSVAEATNIKKGDKIVRAAGFYIGNIADLIEVVSRQAPGTWLPLKVERDGKPIELIAKFPAKPERKS
jgi:uncharacterized iron-regulated protein